MPWRIFRSCTGCKPEETHEIISVRKAGIPAEFRTECPLNGSQERYRYINYLVVRWKGDDDNEKKENDHDDEDGNN